jgi:hypothetical protein
MLVIGCQSGDLKRGGARSDGDGRCQRGRKQARFRRDRRCRNGDWLYQFCRPLLVLQGSNPGRGRSRYFDPAARRQRLGRG